MAKAKTLEFANVTLTFGPTKIMEDFLDEIVIPGLTDPKLIRTYGGTRYFFNDVKLLNLGSKSNPEPAAVGTFIKDTTIRREQVWDDEKHILEKNDRRLRSSPSVTFVLLLATHKLLYLHETTQAPGLQAFRGTLQNFLVQKYFDFINKTYKTDRENSLAELRAKITKKSLREKWLPPFLDIIPLATEENLEKFVEQFGVLNTLRVEMTKVNAEIDNDPFFRKMRDAKVSIGADKSILIETSEAGLKKKQAIEQLKSVALEGNAQVKMIGKTPNGSPLNVSNDEIRLQIPMKNMPDNLEGKAKRSLEEFNNAISKGTISTSQTDSSAEERIREKFRNL